MPLVSPWEAMVVAGLARLGQHTQRFYSGRGAGLGNEAKMRVEALRSELLGREVHTVSQI